MTMRRLTLAGTVVLAALSGAAALAESRPAATDGGQVATMPTRPAAEPTRDDWFISPNDPRYQANGAPRAGETPFRNAPYAPIHGGGGGNG